MIIFCAYATVPVYEKFFRWLGYGEAIDRMVDAWRDGDRAKALELEKQPDAKPAAPPPEKREGARAHEPGLGRYQDREVGV